MYSCYSKLCNAADCGYIDTVSKDGREIKNVPTADLSHEICMKAVCQNGLAIKDIPKELHSPQLALQAVRQNVSALMYVEQTQSLCDIAVETDGLALQYINDVYKTADLCKIAVQNNVYAIQWAKQTPELCLMAIKGDSKTIMHIKDEFKTNEIYEAVVASPFMGASKYLPDVFKSKFDDFYKKQGYATFGPIKIYMKTCLKTYPCKHYVILENGEPSVMSARTIHEILRDRGISHPHFDKYEYK